MTVTYPGHIYEPDRIALAQSILQKELRKLFLEVPKVAWQAIDNSISGWAVTPERFHLEDGGPRDFWDSFAAILESIKLKPSFTAYITAENISWQKTTLPVNHIQMTSGLEQLKKIPGLEVTHHLTLATIAKVLQEHPEALLEQQELIQQHSRDPAQDKYPIIAMAEKDGVYKVMDGNRRTLKALLDDQQEIEAWVGTMEGSKLRNFWVALSDMFQLVGLFNIALNAGDQPQQQAIAQTLRAIIHDNTVADVAFKTRIASQSDIGRQLLELANTKI